MKSQGLGDDIEKLTKATGIDKVAKKVAKALGKEDCGCKERKDLLNKLIPYGNTKENCMTEDQVREYERIRDKYFVNKKGPITTGKVQFKGKQGHEDLAAMVALYNSVLNRNIKGCQGCNAFIYWDRLTNVYAKL